MYAKLPNRIVNFKALLVLLAMTFSFQSFALDDTYCGSISGFEFSNGTTTTAISHNQSYYINDLPNNFYVNLLVNGYSQSAKFYVKNLDTGQCYVVNENHLPYTFPGGNGAWNYGCGNFEIKAKLYKYDSCGSYCDSETIRFAITCQPEVTCGEISGFEFTNGSQNVTITNNETYALDALPNNFYVDVLVDGASESANLTLVNLTTGQTFNVGENYIPYTIPGGNAAWCYGTGDFKLTGKIFENNYFQGTLCDEEVIYFTIGETTCSQIVGYEFSNFADATVAIVDGADYDLDNLPTDFNINLLTSGDLESAFFTLTNLDTGEVFTKTENAIPYTYPGATNSVWSHGCGTFKICASIFQENYASGTACDNTCVTFTINCEEPCGAIDAFAFSNGSDDLTITEGETYNVADLPTGFAIATLITGASQSVSTTVTNVTTGTSVVVTDNTLPYSYPTAAAWDLEAGSYQIVSQLFSEDNASGTQCDTQSISFTLVDVLVCEATFAGTSTLSSGLAIVIPGVTSTVTVNLNNDAILPDGYSLATVITKGDDLTIEGYSENLVLDVPEAGGFYKVHTLAYNPTTFDLDDLTLGTSTANDILDLIANNQICADLDAVGSQLMVIVTGSTDRNSDLAIDQVKGNQDIEAHLSADIRLFPNPVVTQLNVNVDLLKNEILNYAMIDVNGKQILSGQLSNNSNVINTSNLAAGFYILKLNSEVRQLTKKIMVRK